MNILVGRSRLLCELKFTIYHNFDTTLTFCHGDALFVVASPPLVLVLGYKSSL